MIMINPSLQNAYTVATEGVQQTQSVFFGLMTSTWWGIRDMSSGRYRSMAPVSN